MMNPPDHKFEIGQRVRLVKDALYPLALHGMEGWVRKLNHDNLGYPMVFIEWDKDHWAYNGEGDEWTMEAHFEAVEDKVEDPMERLLRELREGQHEQENIPQDEREGLKVRDIIDLIDWPTREEYKQMLAKAAVAAQDGEAFVLLHIQREGDNLVPVLTNVYLNAESAILMEAQLSRIGALAHSDLASQMISMIFTEKDQDGP